MSEKHGCLRLGILLYEGKGLRQDFVKARAFLEKSCNLKNADGCYNLAVIYYNGDGIRQDKYLAKQFYGMSCDLGSQEGCDEYRKLNQQGY